MNNFLFFVFVFTYLIIINRLILKASEYSDPGEINKITKGIELCSISLKFRPPTPYPRIRLRIKNCSDVNENISNRKKSVDFIDQVSLINSNNLESTTITNSPVKARNLDTFYQPKLISKSDDYDYLSKMNNLEPDELLDALKLAHEQIKKSKKLRIKFDKLFEKIIDQIIPKFHPESFSLFIKISVKPAIIKPQFSMFCEHINLLSESNLSFLVKEIETKYVWILNDVDDFKRFNFMIIEIVRNFNVHPRISETVDGPISAKIPEKIDFLDLNHVKKSISMTMAMKQQQVLTFGPNFVKTLSKVQFVYISTFLLNAVKSFDQFTTEEYIKKMLHDLFSVGRKKLDLDTVTLLTLIEPIWNVLIYEKFENHQEKSIELFMKILHQVILAQKDLSKMPENVKGIEDLYVYVLLNLKNLTHARMKFYHSSRLTKVKLLILLKFADQVNFFFSDLIFILLGSVKIDENHFKSEEIDALSKRLQMFLKGVFSLPPEFNDEICTPKIELHHSKKLIWNLQPDIFVLFTSTKKNTKESYKLIEAAYNLPRLFLALVFRLPLNEIEHVQTDLNELPDSWEVIDVTNFFLERWCRIKSGNQYPLVKVINLIKR